MNRWTQRAHVKKQFIAGEVTALGPSAVMALRREFPFEAQEIEVFEQQSWKVNSPCSL